MLSCADLTGQKPVARLKLLRRQLVAVASRLDQPRAPQQLQRLQHFANVPQPSAVSVKDRAQARRGTGGVFPTGLQRCRRRVLLCIEQLLRRTAVGGGGGGGGKRERAEGGADRRACEQIDQN